MIFFAIGLSACVVALCGLTVCMLRQLRRLRFELERLSNREWRTTVISSHRVCTAGGIEACKLSAAFLDREVRALKKTLDYYKKIEPVISEKVPEGLKCMRTNQAKLGPFPIGVVLPDTLLPSEEAQLQLNLLSTLRSKYHGDARASVPGKEDKR